jgi:hypothetical protein
LLGGHISIIAEIWKVSRVIILEDGGNIREDIDAGAAKPGGLLIQDLGYRLFAIGAYMGEVVRRNAGGEWVGDDNNPEAEITVELHLRNTTVCRPVQR